jgi:CHASE3 domain sensor protein
MIDAIIIAGIFILVLIIYVSFLSILKIKSKVEELNIKLDYIENKLDN